MKKQWIWIVVLILCISAVLYVLLKPSNSGESDTTNVKVVNDGDTESQEEESTSESTETEITDFTEFSLDEQAVGEENESEFSLDSILDESEGGYHKFTFALSSEGEDAPYVTAEYVEDSGVIRVDLNMVMEDNSGIIYQGYRKVNIDGISRLYHNISSDETEEIYEVGLASESVFKLESEQTDTGWNVVLMVKYPGESDVNIDTGSEEFAVDDQSIEGVGENEGASVTGYSYSVSSGVLSFVWTVSSDVTNPLPSVSASYTEDNILIVTFESLSLDKVVSGANGMELYGGVNISSSRAGYKSVYEFNGIGGTNEYKLIGSTSPNQIQLLIQL